LDAVLKDIYRILKPGGNLIATVWKTFELMPVVREVMTKILEKPPPPSPINPLALADPADLDPKLHGAGFQTAGDHNALEELIADLGAVGEEKTFKVCFSPLLPTLRKMKEERPDVMVKAKEAFEAVAAPHTKNGHFCANGVYRVINAHK